MSRFVLVPVLLLLACETTHPCDFVRRCNEQFLEHCVEGSGPLVEETCSGPNKCIAMGDDFAGCGIPSADGGATACDGVFVCISGHRRVCETSELMPGSSWVRGSACASGSQCVADGGQVECL